MSQDKILLTVNKSFISVNSNEVREFTRILRVSDQPYEYVNQYLLDIVGKSDYLAVIEAIEKHCEDNEIERFYDCIDNNRYAIKHDEEQEKAYEVKRINGCCGIYDVVITVDTSSHYQNSSIDLMYGFNYGH